MFYEYAYAKADELEKMQLDLYNKSGIAWNDTLARESDNEDSDDDDDVPDTVSEDDMETDEYELVE